MGTTTGHREAALASQKRVHDGFLQAKRFREHRSYSTLVPKLGPEPVFKAAGRNLPVGASVKRVVREEFAQREAGARRSDGRLAASLLEPILSLLRRGASGNSGKELARLLVRTAKERAAAVAGSINDTTAKIIADEGEPYTDERATMVGMTEANWAIHQAEGIVARLKGLGKKTWQAKPGACDQCRALHGKTIKLDAEFVSKKGVRVQHSPLHPHCDCSTKYT